MFKSLNIPVVNFHGAVLCQVDLHLEDAVEKLRLMSCFSGQAILGGDVEVFLEERFVIRMGALVDDELGAGFRIKAAQIGQTLLGNEDIQVMLGMIDMGHMGHNAGDAGRIGL